MLCSASGGTTQSHDHLRGGSKPGLDHHTRRGFLVDLKGKEIREHQVQPCVICVGFCLQFIISNITQFIAWCIDGRSAQWVVTWWQHPAWGQCHGGSPTSKARAYMHRLRDQNMRGPWEGKPCWVEAVTSTAHLPCSL